MAGPTSTSTRRSPINFRLFTLPTILLLSVVTLVLAVVYVNALSPHSQSQTGAVSSLNNTTAHDSGHMFTDIPYPDPNLDYGSYSGGTRNVTHHNTTASPHLSDNSTNSTRGALLGYAATLPILSIIHASLEMGVSLLTPVIVSKTTSHPTRSYLLFLLSTMVTTGLIVAWVITDASWISCELAHNTVCPSSVLLLRGHGHAWAVRMSTARVAMGWLVVTGYIVHSSLVIITAVREGGWGNTYEREMGMAAETRGEKAEMEGVRR